MRSFAKWSCAVLLGGLNFAALTSTSAFGAFQVTENFNGNTDLAGSGWTSLNNRAALQNYGWSSGDNTGSSVNPPGPDGIPGNADDGVATGGGELGGPIYRPPIPAAPSTDEPTPTYYGFDVGTVDPATEGFNVSGVIRSNRRDGAVFLGYFIGADSFPDRNKNAANFIGVLVNDGGAEIFSQIYNPTGSREGAQFAGIPTDGTVVPFSLEYNPPPAGTGNGSLRVSFGANSGVQNIPSNIVLGIDDLTHFGVFPQVRDAGPNESFSEIYLDDLTFTSENPIPEPTGLALLGVGLMIALRRRRM